MAIIDSSVLIHLSRIGKLNLLKDFFGEVTITGDVYRETVEEAVGKVGISEIKKACEDWIKVKDVKNKTIKEMARLEGVEEADASLIILAKEEKDVLISNDYVMISLAKSKGLRSWWLTALLLKAVKKKLVSRKEAKRMLSELVKSGLRLKIEVYEAVLNEIDRLELPTEKDFEKLARFGRVFAKKKRIKKKEVLKD